MYWAANKERFLRQLLISDIEDLTGRRLGVLYCHPEFDSTLRHADVARLYEIVKELDEGPFDLLIETTGGDTNAAEAMISLLIQAQHPFRAIVANRAKSNGTLLCLAAESILMGPASELGPIEPLINKIPVSTILEAADPELVIDKVEATHAKEQTIHVAKRALRHRMLKPESTEEDVHKVIDPLCSRSLYPSHGSVIDGNEAAAIGLNVVTGDSISEIWDRIWLLYCMYTTDNHLRHHKKSFETNHLSLVVPNGRD